MVVLRVKPEEINIPPGIEDVPVGQRRTLLRQLNPKLDLLIGRLAGAVDVYFSRGQLVARSWPRNPRQPNSRAQLLARRAFSVMCANWSALGVEDKRAWVNRAKGGQRIPRDLFGQEFLRFWFKYNFWPIVNHVQISNAFGGSLQVGTQTQYECYSELHYSFKPDLQNFDVTSWWSQFCEKHGAFLGSNTGSFCSLAHKMDSWSGYASDAWFSVDHYDPTLYPMLYMIINRDIHGQINGMSGLYAVGVHQDGSHPVQIVKDSTGKLDPIKPWAYLWTEAWKFPTVPIIP
jgi:hypothetical protein